MIKTFQNNFLLQKLFFKRSEIDQVLLLSCFFSCTLLSVRIAVTGTLFFSFLVWNLFLAYIPYAVSTSIVKQFKNELIKWKFFLYSFLWLLFLPNSFYIITDLFHLAVADTMPLWFDLALIISFAWNGLVLGILSVRQMEKLVVNKFEINNQRLIIYPIMLLNAFGIYIGRYLRFNSWDIVTNPFPLARDIIHLLHHPLRNKIEWSMIICYSLLMTLIYFSAKRLNHQ